MRKLEKQQVKLTELAVEETNNYMKRKKRKKEKKKTRKNNKSDPISPPSSNEQLDIDWELLLWKG